MRPSAQREIADPELPAAFKAKQVVGTSSAIDGVSTPVFFGLSMQGATRVAVR
jgi:hypothetical protein